MVEPVIAITPPHVTQINNVRRDCSDLLDGVASFAAFLSARDHSLQNILDHLVRVVFMPLEIDSIALFQENNQSEYSVTGSSGITRLANAELLPTYTFDDKFPVSEALRYGKIIWLSDSKAALALYPILKNFPLVVGVKTLITVPIFRFSTPVAVFSITSRKHEESNSENLAFLSAITTVFSMYYYRNVLSSPDESDDKEPKNKSITSDSSKLSLELTERQLVILRLISEERTNQGISQFLGYSESTIRQEVMRIFAKIGCAHRSEAAAIYRSYSANS